MPEIKEKPILFSTPMVQAILDGRKTMTRRVVKPQPVFDKDSGYIYFKDCQIDIHRPNLLKQFCPYGQVDDRLWVRETWMQVRTSESKDLFIYKTDEHLNEPIKGWKPSIHMPRAACRIILEITDIRVERLQDISESDAIAEGISQNFLLKELFYEYGADIISPSGETTRCWVPPVESFKSLWQSINGKTHPWKANPWLWVISFKKVTP